eukprot:jgi/Mesvir1/27074/Mv20766-RA.1
MISAEGLFLGYRRDGPEVPLLGNRQVVAVPAPANDTLALAYGYVPDENGLPLLNGSMVKLCATGSCPPVLDPKVYVPPTTPPLTSPAWTLGKNTRKGGLTLYMIISSALEPTLSAVSSFKGQQGEQVAILTMSALSRRLQAYIQATSAVQDFGGRICIAEGPRLNILSASNGSLFAPPLVAGQRPTLLSAVNSTDEVTRETARFLNRTYGGELFARPIETEAHLGSEGSHYVHSMPLVFEGLKLVVMLAVRRGEFRDAIEDARHKGLIFTMVIIVSMFVVGGLAICISTIFVSRKLRAQEKGLGEAAEANKALREQLQSLTERHSHDWPTVDMGTPLEKLTTIIKSLKPGCALSPEQVHQMQVLITADDLHKPQFLADIRSADADAKGNLADSETGKWISLIATGRRAHGHMSVMSSSQATPSSEGSPGGRRWAAGWQDAVSHKVGHAVATHPIPEDKSVHDSSLRTSSHIGQVAVSLESGHVAVSIETGHVEVRIVENGDFLDPTKYQQGLSSSSTGGKKTMEGTRCFSIRSYSRAGNCTVCELETLKLTVQCAMPRRDEARGGRWRRRTSLGIPNNDISKTLAVSPRTRSLTSGTLPPSSPTMPVCPASFMKQQRQQVGELSQLGCWDFNVLALDAAAGEMTIPLVGYSLFLRAGFIVEFDINEQKLVNFLSEISRGMTNNAYHNAAHIADVSASVFHLLTHSGVGDHLRSIDKLAIVCAALIHDYKHPGVNNDFLIRTREELATMYNDHSPLENYHLAEAFYLLYNKDECNFLEVLSEEDFMELRRVVINVVLASDLKRHFGVLDALKARVAQEAPWDVERDSDRIMLLQMLLKVADIGHSAKPLALHKEWSHRVIEEFYRQGDEERALSLKVSPFMDRHNNNIPRSQVCFFQFLAVPLFKAWVKCFPASGHLLQNMTQNVAFWKQEVIKQGSSPS